MMSDELKRARRAETEKIGAMLRERVEDLAPLLLPEGRRAGRDWRAGGSGSRSIVLSGPRRGTYCDFRAGEKGTDLLGAIAALRCAGSIREAIVWARAWLGLGAMSPAELARAEQRAAARLEEDRKREARDTARRQRQAGGIWHSAAPIAGTAGERYLAGRGIALDRLAARPGALRYSANVWCKTRAGQHPAMLASLWKIGSPNLVAVHRTFLDLAPDGTAAKARVDPVRSILGSWPGAVIPIQRGETGARWKDIAEGEMVAFGEGIEEALSIALVQPGWRVGAVGSVGNFARIELPVWCHVMLCINNDPPKSAAGLAIFGNPATGRIGAVEALTRRGHVVRVLRPPEGFKDWNDLLQGKRHV